MLEDGQAEAGVTGIVGMQTVVAWSAFFWLWLSKIDTVIGLHREET